MHTFFSSKSANDTSYKYGFLKSILDNLYNTDYELTRTFDQLFSKFTEIYWNLVLKYHILQKSQGKLDRRSRLERVLIYGKEKYGILEDIQFESISDDMKIDICHRVKGDCKRNVVWIFRLKRTMIPVKCEPLFQMAMSHLGFA